MGYIKDAWKFFRGQDADIRKQTPAVQDQVRRPMERRSAQQKLEEEAVCSILDEMKKLERRLNEAMSQEAAVVEYVGKVAEKAKQQIEAELCKEHEIQRQILQEQEEKFKKTVESSFAEIEARAAAKEAFKNELTKIKLTLIYDV